MQTTVQHCGISKQIHTLNSTACYTSILYTVSLLRSSPPYKVPCRTLGQSKQINIFSEYDVSQYTASYTTIKEKSANTDLNTIWNKILAIHSLHLTVLHNKWRARYSIVKQTQSSYTAPHTII